MSFKYINRVVYRKTKEKGDVKIENKIETYIDVPSTSSTISLSFLWHLKCGLSKSLYERFKK